MVIHKYHGASVSEYVFPLPTTTHFSCYVVLSCVSFRIVHVYDLIVLLQHALEHLVVVPYGVVAKFRKDTSLSRSMLVQCWCQCELLHYVTIGPLNERSLRVLLQVFTMTRSISLVASEHTNVHGRQCAVTTLRRHKLPTL